MRTIFTQLRNITLAAFLSIVFTNSFAQTIPADNAIITNLKATVVNNNLLIDWNIAENVNTNFCEVQASTDGKTFTTIGLVLGADPSQNNNSFKFKQNVKNLKAGQVYYRVLTIENNNNASSSNVVKTTI